MLGMPARLNGSTTPHLAELLVHGAEGEAIRVADHCYGCTAGQGSSCGGALAGSLAGSLAGAPVGAEVDG
jgi:hypothetical protein